MNHSFDTNVAQKYGIEEAILLQYLYFWIEKNRANEKHFYNGTYWTYNSKKALSILFPYMTPRKIDYALKNLVEKGLVITGYFNEKPTDRTLWYALTKLGYCILQNCEMETTKLSNDYIYNNINNNTDIEHTDIKESIINNNTKESFEKIFEHWNKKKIVVHRNIDDFKTKIKNALKEHTAEEIILAVDHYSEILNDGSYFYKYKWNLNDFLGREKGYEEFLDKGSKWQNYLEFKNKKQNSNPYKSKEEVSSETKYTDYKDIGYL